MTDLKWLRDLSEGRTAGPWAFGETGCGAFEVVSGLSGEHDWRPETLAKLKESVIYPAERFSVDESPGGCPKRQDARFIAAAGTLWDKLVAIAEAAAVEHGKANEPECPICQALVALQAARKEVE